jgi:S-adenosylmethionine:tRNA ribosyltransferase-isomerase
VLLRNLGAVKDVVHLHFADAPEIEAGVTEHLGEGEYRMRVNSPEPAVVILSRIGRMPLPPYIKRDKEHDQLDDLDRERYQTVYAREDGSVAAPTAGLHFATEILEQLDAKGVQRAFVTLHVGLGTFKPVGVDELSDHKMHGESYTLPRATVDAINLAKQENRRVIAVGTTSARVLESQPSGELRETSRETSIFIYPPYQWKHVDALITNFHLPRSTLIALVAAKVGLDEQRHIYREAIEKGYRFFSYGDSSFLE